MSNKIVPTIYRTVIDEVVQAIKGEFDEYGVSEEVLADLQHRWEEKVIASHVAEFENPTSQQQANLQPQQLQKLQQQQHQQPQAGPSYQQMNMYQQSGMPIPYVPPPGPPHIKQETNDNRYVLSSLPGPQLNLPPGGMHAFPGPSGARAPPQHIPQLDGSADDDEDGNSEDDDQPPSQQKFAPRAAHPSLPQPSSTAAQSAEAEAINSDLDDSDTGDDEDADDGGAADTDIVFCTYDKVARVKNKWKCVLKDGMVHVNGKDYLFAKCNGEFEW